MEIAARSGSQKCRWCVTGPDFNFPHPSLPLLSSPFVWASSPLTEGNSVAAASPLYQQRPHSRRTKMNRWRGSQPPGRAAGARHAAGGRVILSRWYRRTPKKTPTTTETWKSKSKKENRATGSGLMLEPLCQVYDCIHERIKETSTSCSGCFLCGCCNPALSSGETRQIKPSTFGLLSSISTNNLLAELHWFGTAVTQLFAIKESRSNVKWH